MIRRVVCLVALCTTSLASDDSSQPSVTIYNQNFAVVRQELPLELKPGVNSVRVTDITMHLEPDSVILREPGRQTADSGAGAKLPCRSGIRAAPAFTI